MATSETAAQVDPDEIRAIPVRHPGRWVAAAIIFVLAVAVVDSMASNPRFQWGVVRDYLFSDRILQRPRGHAGADGRRRWQSGSSSGWCWR